MAESPRVTTPLAARPARRTALLGALAASVLGSTLALATPAATAQAACATTSGKAITGTVFGQDGRDVNVSIGFDLVDRNGRALNGDPKAPGYGCPKTGPYSVPHREINHFVGPEGQAPNSVMRDAQGREQGRTTRAWAVRDVPSNAVGAYIEVYHRGYTGSPCKDASGNWCFNHQTLTKYGNSNKHLVPVGTANLPIRLPMTCRYGGTAGSILGKVLDAAGRPAKVKSLYAWTETKWNAWPYYQGWGIANVKSDGSYHIPSLASKQRYVLWLTTADGRVHKRFGIPVNDCKATPLNWRV